MRDAYGDERATLLGELGASDGNAALEFSRNGWRNPLGGARAQVQRVRWRLAGETLERLYWNVLDQAVDSQPRVQKVLTRVQSMNLRFLDDQGQWQEQWPPSQSTHNAQDAKKRMPLALEVKIEHRHYGELSRLYRLPEPAMAEEESNAQPPDGEQPGEKEQGGTVPAEKPTDDESGSGGNGATQ